MSPWPRRIFNFPIIMIAIAQEIIWAMTLLWDQSSSAVTAVSILAKFVSIDLLITILLGAAILGIFGFFMKTRLQTLLSLIPQQLLLYLSAGGAVEAIWKGAFADGVQRNQAFLLADQCPAFLIAFFHTWALLLILHYAED